LTKPPFRRFFGEKKHHDVVCFFASGAEKGVSLRLSKLILEINSGKTCPAKILEIDFQNR